ncbi:transposase [Nostoc sp.]
MLGYFERRTTQGIVEGINQKTKFIKRRAYGLCMLKLRHFAQSFCQ